MKNDLNGLNNLVDYASKMGDQVKKSLNSQINQFEKVIKQLESKKEKRGKINKMSGTMILGQDDSVKIVFDDPKDGIKFFEGIK